MSNSLPLQESYAIADFQKNYISLLVCVYRDAQFFVLFNERKTITRSQSPKSLIKTYGKTLAKLVQKAEQVLGIQIKKTSYNLKANKTQIINHSYIHQFEKQIPLTEKELNIIYENFKKENTENDYRIFLAKITEFHLIDQNEKSIQPPMNAFVKSIKVSGLLYKIHWKTIFFYLQIFKTAKVFPHQPVLFPYAAHISLFASSNAKKIALIIWNENEWQLCYFVNKIFQKQIFFRKSLSYLIEKITNKFNFKYDDVKNYLFHLLNLDEDDNKKILIAIDAHNKQLTKQHKEIQELVAQYILQIINETIFVLKEKNNIDIDNLAFNITGDITRISNLNNFLSKNLAHLKWIVPFQNFVGIKDFNDLFLIGNAYYQHLENKLIYNEKIEKK